MEGAKQGSNNEKREVEPESYKPTWSEAVRSTCHFSTSHRERQWSTIDRSGPLKHESFLGRTSSLDQVPKETVSWSSSHRVWRWRIDLTAPSWIASQWSPRGQLTITYSGPTRWWPLFRMLKPTLWCGDPPSPKVTEGARNSGHVCGRLVRPSWLCSVAKKKSLTLPKYVTDLQTDPSVVGDRTQWTWLSG